MRGIIPARIPVHKAHKVKLQSHLDEYIFQTRGEIKPSFKKAVRSIFQTPDLNVLYSQGSQGVSL